MGMVWVARLANEDEIAQVRADPDSACDYIDSEKDTRPFIDLDKEWHALHFLLTGSVDPTNDPMSLILGDFEEIGEDCGYGPAFFISAKKFKAFNEAAANLDSAALKERYKTEEMVAQNVYLGEMYHREGEEGLNFLTERLDELREFAAKAASGGLGAFAMIT
ncbi:MAG: YfbM family protein [Pseudomonadota bacterium]